jgi:cysteinyl-tRNA synthetase
LIEDFRGKFKEALSNDLNISLALSHALTFVKEINKDLDALKISDIEKIRSFIFEMDDTFGFIGKSYDNYIAELNKKLKSSNIADLLKRREDARKIKDYAESDMLRKEITQSGLSIEDTKNGYILKIE